MQSVHEARALITTELDVAIKTKSCSTYTFLREHAPMQTPLPVFSRIIYRIEPSSGNALFNYPGLFVGTLATTFTFALVHLMYQQHTVAVDKAS